MGLEVPQGVVGWLVVGRIALGGWAVLQQQQRDRQHNVTQLEVTVQYLATEETITIRSSHRS